MNLLENKKKYKDNKLKIDLSRLDYWTILAIIIGILLRVYLALKDSIWYDEAFTIITIKHDFSTMLKIIFLDRVHPPLFYVLIKIWTLILGDSLFSLRGFPLLWSLLQIIVIYKIGKIFSKNIAKTLIIIFSLSNFFINYGVEIRSYSFISFWASLTIFAIIRLILALNNKTSNLNATNKPDKTIQNKKVLYSNKDVNYKRVTLLILELLISIIILLKTHYLQGIFLIALIASVTFSMIFDKLKISNPIKKLFVFFMVILGTFSILSQTKETIYSIFLDEYIRKREIQIFNWIPEQTFDITIRPFYSFVFGMVHNTPGIPALYTIKGLKYSSFIAGIISVIFIYLYVTTNSNYKIQDNGKTKLIDILVFTTFFTFIGFAMISYLGIKCYIERYMIAGGTTYLVSWGILLHTFIKQNARRLSKHMESMYAEDKHFKTNQNTTLIYKIIKSGYIYPHRVIMIIALSLLLLTERSSKELNITAILNRYSSYNITFSSPLHYLPARLYNQYFQNDIHTIKNITLGILYKDAKIDKKENTNYICLLKNPNDDYKGWVLLKDAEFTQGTTCHNLKTSTIIVIPQCEKDYWLKIYPYLKCKETEQGINICR